MNTKKDYKNVDTLRTPLNLLLHWIFLFFYGFVKYLPIPVLGNWLRYIVLKTFMAELHSIYISEMVTIYFPWNIKIGKHCSLNQSVIIDGAGGVKIGNGVRIAPNVLLSTADHLFSKEEFIYQQGFKIGSICIEDDVWIGANTIITKGVIIGKGAVIGAGSVVTKNIPPYSIAHGNPCKVEKKRE